MSRILKISSEDKIEYFNRVIIPSFNPLNKLNSEEDRDDWMVKRAVEAGFEPKSAAELRVMYGYFSSLEKVLAKRTELIVEQEEERRERADETERRERLERAEEMERKAPGMDERWVHYLIDVRFRLLNLPGDKGATTYADYIQKLIAGWSFRDSSSLDAQLESIWQKFCTAQGGDVEKGFTFAPLKENVIFPAQVAAQNNSKRILDEPSHLSEKERASSPVWLMDNLQEPHSTQDFVSAVMMKLKEEMTIYTPAASKFQIASHPDPMAYAQKSFGNRSPDLPFWSDPNTTSPHCITFMLDVKPCEVGEFKDEQIGHIIDMAQELLNTEQKNRHGMICGLTDGSRFQFFRVKRFGSGGGAYDISVEASRIFLDKEGWQVLIALMALSLDDPFLMHQEHRVAGLKLQYLLGHGARSSVYKVEADATEGESKGSSKDRRLPYHLPDRSFCKVYTRPPEGERGRSEGWRGFEQERAALLRLQDVPNIPKIFKETSTLPPVQSWLKPERVLVLSPVGRPLWPALSNVVLTGHHFAQLVTTVEAMHSAGVLHRDIKPANVFLQEDTGPLLLADFDAAVVLEEVKKAKDVSQQKRQTRGAKGKESLTLEALTLANPTPTPTLTPAPTPAPKVWKMDQKFTWIGTVGYSDARPKDRDNFLHTPTPEHDLVALVRTVYSLYTMKGPIGPRQGDGTHEDDTDAYWAARMPPSSMWQDFLQMARDKDYGALRLALGRL